MPLDERMKLRLNRSNNGYMPLRGHAQRHTTLNKDPKPNENESFFARRERDPTDPDVIAGHDLRDPNQWPEDLSGFKETVLEYQEAMRGLEVPPRPTPSGADHPMVAWRSSGSDITSDYRVYDSRLVGVDPRVTTPVRLLHNSVSCGLSRRTEASQVER